MLIKRQVQLMIDLAYQDMFESVADDFTKKDIEALAAMGYAHTGNGVYSLSADGKLELLCQIARMVAP